MQTFGNLAVGAIFAGLTMGPGAWTEARQALDARLSDAKVVISAVEHFAPNIDHAWRAARAALPRLQDGGRIDN
jgi:hypothetical protein